VGEPHLGLEAKLSDVQLPSLQRRAERLQLLLELRAVGQLGQLGGPLLALREVLRQPAGTQLQHGS
jgi:hypothetical protein